MSYLDDCGAECGHCDVCEAGDLVVTWTPERGWHMGAPKPLDLSGWRLADCERVS